MAQVPRLVSWLDREPFSKVWGSADRTFWAWKFTDFPGARFQEAAYALAKLYWLDREDNALCGHPKTLEWAAAVFDNWTRVQHANGSFDEAYPFEQSLAATAFTGFYVGEAFGLLGDRLSEGLRASVANALRKAADWLCRNDESHGVLSNHLAAAAAALTVIHTVTKDAAHAARSRHFLQRIYDRQSDEGWYEEYGGADPGYQTHGTFYLARVWQLTGDATLLKSLARSVAFIKHFVHPDGTIGGEYGSRNTEFYFPAGFEILAPVCPNAAAIAAFMRPSLACQRLVGIDSMDAYNFLPILNNYLAAAEAARPVPAGRSMLPCEMDGHWEFPDAGLIVTATGRHVLVVGASKGGVVKLFERGPGAARLVASHCGWWMRLRGGVISSQALVRPGVTRWENGDFVVSTDFVKVRQRLMRPWLFLAFRLFCLTAGRAPRMARWIKGRLVSVLVHPPGAAPARLERRIRLDDDALVIDDHITPRGSLDALEIRAGEKFTAIHMGSSRYFQLAELTSRPPDLGGVADAAPLSRGEPLSVRSTWRLS